MIKLTGKNITRALLSMMLSVSLVVAPWSSALAAATIEVSGDFGVIGGPFTFGATGINYNSPDATAPEGVNAIQVNTNGGGGWGTGNNGTSNYSAYAGGDLRFWIRSNNTIRIEIEHTTLGTKSFVDIPSTGNAWQRQVIPFATGFDTPVNLNNIFTLILASDFVDPGTNEWWMDHIRWTKPLDHIDIFPTNTDVNSGKNRQFTTEGRDAANELIILYPTFTAAGVGTMAPTDGRSSILTATGSDGNVTATDSGKNVNAAVDITANNLDAELGILSETIDGISLDIDSKLLVASGGGAGDPTLTDDLTEFREGLKSVKTTLEVASGFTGWYIQHDLNPDDAITKDMSNYYDGAVRFLFKAPAALNGTLKVGIRSGNVPAGLETSKVTLNGTYYPFDNTWQHVIIPVADLVGDYPKADLSRIKIFFSIFADASTSGAQSFFIDNLRWDTRIPGALDSISVTPNPGFAQTNSVPTFVATGFDANGVRIDVWPNWSKTGLAGSTLQSTVGERVKLTAASSPETGTLIATQNAVSGNTPVTIVTVSEDQVYQGLIDKQHGTTGLVISFNGDTNLRAVTYDQALVAMNYTYRGDTAKAVSLFNYYKTRFDLGGFEGFHEEYKWNVAAGGGGSIFDFDRSAGPNAFLLLALMHYRNVTGDTTYDAMMAAMATWISSLQDADGAIKFGFQGPAGTPLSNKSTEHNMDVYAVFLAYARITGNNSWNTEAAEILNWLETEAWDGTRFNVGETAAGAANTDKALDVYSWAVLALSDYTSVLPLAETDFRNTQTNNNTGLAIDGFDFSSLPGNPVVDKDAVWLEGTMQMALAFLFDENFATYDYYMQQTERAIFPINGTSQGLSYATNAGTAYGFIMPFEEAAASSMSWYLFAKRNFNPFKPFRINKLEIRNISDNNLTTAFNWTVSVPAQWVRSNQYVEMEAQAITNSAWGIQIFTDNANPGNALQFVDPTPGLPNNPDSDPAGLLENINATTGKNLPSAWNIRDKRDTLPTAANPLGCPTVPEACAWLFLRDLSTPGIDFDGDGSIDVPGFANGEVGSTLKRRGATFNGEIQHSQATFGPGMGSDFIFLQSNFNPASATIEYKADIIIEFFHL